MLSEYSCHDEGMCDCICPNYDCIHHQIHNRQKFNGRRITASTVFTKQEHREAIIVKALSLEMEVNHNGIHNSYQRT